MVEVSDARGLRSIEGLSAQVSETDSTGVDTLRTDAPVDSLRITLPADSGLDTPVPDSLMAKSDTLVQNGTEQAVLVDSSAAVDTTVFLPPIVPPDTTAPGSLTLTRFRLTQREWHRQGFKDAGEALSVIPGLYPRHAELYGSPFYLVPPGGNARDLGVMYNDRPYSEPVTGATNWTTVVPEEIQIAEYSAVAPPELPSSAGTLRWIAPYRYEEIPVSRVVYRQGWYGLGRADVRIAQQVHPGFAYHIGVNIGEFQGRYTPTASNTSHLRLGGRQTIRGVGHLTVAWMQARSRWGRAFDRGNSSFHRNDIDIVLESGLLDSTRQIRQEVGFWYVRSQTGYSYGDEDGYRLGLRAQRSQILAGRFPATGRIDLEQVAARFPRRTQAIDPQASRWTLGSSGHLRFTWRGWQGQGSLRVEGSTVSLSPDTADISPTLQAGGSIELTRSLLGRLKVMTLANSSWRYPGLDELGGYWSVRSPDRWMDVYPVPDYTTYSVGNPTLEPVKTQFVGGGVRVDWIGTRQVYLLTGVRRWEDRIQAYAISDDTWSRRNLDATATFETTVYAWLPIYGPLSVAGTMTYAEPLAIDAPVPDAMAMGSLRFDDYYYNGQLRIRATLNARYWGGYSTSWFVQPSATLLEALINFKVFDFEAYYGTRNILGASYHYIPYYPNLHREEIWGVRWVLFK